MNGKEKAERHSLLTMPPCGNTITSLWACAFIISVFFDELDLSKNIFAVQEKKNDEEEVYSEEEIPLIKDYLLQKDTLRYLGVLLVFVTGMRVGELSALKPEDIQLKKKAVQSMFAVQKCITA